jgi:hypothetical protein
VINVPGAGGSSDPGNAEPDPVAVTTSSGTTVRVLPAVSQIQIRDELEQLVMADLLGPAGGPEEIVDESSVRDRYLVGMLAPKRSHGDAAQDDNLEIEQGGAPEEGGAEAEVSGPNWMFPSAFGMTSRLTGPSTRCGSLHPGGCMRGSRARTRRRMERRAH